MTGPDNSNYIIQNQSDIAVLKNDVARMSEFFSKLDTAIEKISDLSNSITRMLAVHDERLDKQEETNAKIFVIVEAAHKDLYEKVSYGQTERNKISNHVDVLDISIKTLTETLITQHEHTIKMNSKRITELEHWRWILVGGFLTVAGILSYFGPSLLVNVKH